MSNLAEQVHMLVEENRTRVAMAGGQANDEERIGSEAKAPVASHSHPYSEPRNSRHYQPVDSLKERDCRPARSASVFDRLGDEAESHQRKAPFHKGRMVAVPEEENQTRMDDSLDPRFIESSSEATTVEDLESFSVSEDDHSKQLRYDVG
ncbi:hypothetical protein Fot_28719 [Forsythia ovata]|uniref:Uncharacterized protein n=1 Tax=Forsythia ovata TaxID=205694 RepID=A0ABD1TQ93_9LAMI